MAKAQTLKVDNLKQRVTGLEWVTAGELAAHPGNWRDHPATQAAAMAGVLREVGIADALLAYRSARNDGKLTLIDGHLRRDLATAEKWPVLVLDVDDAEADYILATHDPLAALAQADKAALDALLSTINSGEAAVQQMLADEAAKAGLYLDREAAGDDPGAQVDKAEELRVKWGVEPGQLWQLGEHRLICGDCTDKAVVDRVMGGEKATAVVTDSPYGMGVEGVENDDEKNLRGLFDGCLRVMPIENAVVVNFQGARLFNEWIDATQTFGHRFERALWLYKPNDGTYPWRGWLQTGQIILLSSVGSPVWGEGAYKHDTYEVNFVGDEFEKMHATPKPLEVIEHIVSWVSRPGRVVYDPFSGGATTLIACEKLGRKCRAVEISPAYVAVALERFYQMTSVLPVLEASS